MSDALDAGCPSGLAPPTDEGVKTDFSAFVRTKKEGNQLDLIVRGAKCGGCINKIETALADLPGVKMARLNLSTGRLNVLGDASFNANQAAAKVSSLGYGVSAQSIDDTETEKQSEEKKLLIAMAVAGFAAANIMLLSVSVWGGAAEMGEQTRFAMHAISGLIAFPVVLFSGRHFFQSAWAALRHGHVNMDVPISLAISLAFGTSVWVTLSNGEHAYFDACVMLIFFLLIGRFLDARLRRRAYSAAHDLAALQSHSVTRLIASGPQSVRAHDILPGDKLLLTPGERAIIDMEITKGQSDVDESLVTGESLPRTASEGMTLYAGSINLGDALEGKAISAASDSLLADIGGLLEAGEQRRSTYRKIADKAVSLYVPFVHTTALLAFVGWLWLGAPVSEAIMVAVCTLIITCPCALALAAPVAQVVASSRLFRNGVFLKSGDALERLAGVDHIVFDKTGTLTLGTPEWISTPESEAALAAAASLARASRHPLSKALVEAAGPGKLAQGTREHAGLGLIATIEGKEHRLGSAEWVGAEDVGASGPVIWYRAGKAAPVAFEFEDSLQGEAADAIKRLESSGLTVEILSGDRLDAVGAIASKLGIKDWKAGASPTEKADHLEALRARGKKVLMVGDGFNDAAALSLAHAALSPGSAIDISQASSDAVYNGHLDLIPKILRISSSARSTMLQNFGLAALYNVIAVPIAVTGNVTPLIAAIAMSASSLIVTLNALRINLGKAQ